MYVGFFLAMKRAGIDDNYKLPGPQPPKKAEHYRLNRLRSLTYEGGKP